MKRNVATVLALVGLAVAWTAPHAASTHDQTPPQTYITGGPSARTTDKTPTFTFSASEKASRFKCKVDGGTFHPCSSPYTTAKLRKGRHGFYVKGVDPFGNKDTTAAARQFKVVRG